MRIGDVSPTFCAKPLRYGLIDRISVSLSASEADMAMSRSILAFIVLLSMSVPLSAQWVHYPTPGIPRTPDGKPNLSAPAPRTPDGKPDLSGVWRADTKYFQD